MSLETAIRSLLLAQNPIASLIPAQTIGAQAFDSVFDEYPPEGIIPPFILIGLKNFDPMETLDGTRGMETTDVDLECYATSKPKAVTLAKQVSDFFKDYTGITGTQNIFAVHWTAKRYERVLNQDGSDARQHILGLSFQIQHQAL